MAKFFTIERQISRWLSAFPHVKMIVKRVYLYLCWLSKLGSRGAKSSHNAIAFTNLSGHNFFGYFDVCPENDASLIIMHHLPDGFKDDTAIEILALSGKTGDIVARATSHAYNWQQGTRAQWLDEAHFIYNDFCSKTKRYVAKIHNVTRDETATELPVGVQSSFKNDYMLSLNIERISAYAPDYGYRNIKADISNQLSDLQQDGIWYCDLKTHNYYLLLTFEQILAAADLPHDDSVHYSVNHISPSPSGEMFVFILRYYSNGRRADKLMLYTLASQQMHVVNHGPIVSHFAWKNDQELILYATDNSGTNRYHCVTVQDGTQVNFHKCLLDGLGDGHPTIMGNKLVIDTYPSRFGIQRLFCFDFKTGQLEELGRFAHSPSFFGATRCDLHPRFAKNGKRVFVDSVASGKRNFYSLDLNA